MRGPSDWNSSTGTEGVGSSGVGGWIVGGLIVVMIFGIVLVTVAVTVLPLFVGFDNPIVSTLIFTLPWLLPIGIMGFVAIIIVVSSLTVSETEQVTHGDPSDTFEATIPGAQPTDPLEVLKERYASGDISVEEYERAVGLLVDADTAEEAHRRLERGDHEQVVGLDDLDVGSDPASDDADVTIELSVEEVEALIDEMHEQE